MFWLVWKHLSIKLEKATLWNIIWPQKTGWPKVGAEWPEDAGVENLGR